MRSVLAAIAFAVSFAQPMNATCGNSPYITGDFLVRPNGKSATITTIWHIYNSDHVTVGWIYGTTGHHRLAIALPLMSEADMKRVGVPMLDPNALHSGLVEIAPTGNPWHDLRIEPCSCNEMAPAGTPHMHSRCKNNPPKNEPGKQLRSVQGIEVRNFAPAD